MLDGAAAGGAVTVAPGWGQGRATYGGLVAGLLFARAEALCADPARRLRSASVAFAGPVAPGEAVVEGRVLRAGGSATQVEAAIVQDGKTRASLLATFGDGRESVVSVAAGPRNPRPELPAPETLDRIIPVPGVTPEFFGQVDLRFGAGSPLFSGAAEPDFGGWMRFASPPRALGDRELVTLADAWPPSIAPLLDGPVPLSTVAWTFEPVGEGSASPDAFWQYDVRTLAAGGGYAHTSARIWDSFGTLRALSRQTVAVFG